MARLSSPPYILAHPADTAGCGFHRIVKPLEVMARAGWCNGRADMALYDDPNRLKAMAPDIIVWQRQHEDSQIEAIKRYREVLPNAFHVYDMDDMMSAAPDYSPHKALIPPKIDTMMRNAALLCDVITVTTDYLAEHVRQFVGPTVDIRIAPNMLTQEMFNQAEAIKKALPLKAGVRRKKRVGWAGGYGHKGDLDIIVPAMRELSTRQDIEWVFFGQRPECEIPVEMHGGVQPHQYHQKYAQLDLDIVLAPLVDNPFNLCKSNIRILDAGMIGKPVIASPVAPHLYGKPPVYYANTWQDWIDQLKYVLDHYPEALKKGEELAKWTKRRYVMDDHLEERVRAWMPRSKTPFVPVNKPMPDSGVVLVCGTKLLTESPYRVFPTLAEALETKSDIVVVRPGVTVNEEQIERMARRLRSAQDVATVVCMSNDGSVSSYPKPGQFTPGVDQHGAEDIDTICRQMYGQIKAEINGSAGPAVALSRRALRACGYPDLSLDNDSAVLEWSTLASAKGFMNLIATDVYVVAPTPQQIPDAGMLLARCQIRYPQKQLAPDPLGAMRWELELEYHKRHYKAAGPSQNSNYSELAGLFGQVGDRDLAWMAAHIPPSIEMVHLTYPITEAKLKQLEQYALKESLTQEHWVLVTADETDLLRHAGYMFAECAAHGGVDMIYADHDYLMENGTRDRHDFKSHTFDRHLFAQRDYITPVFAVKAEWLWQHQPVDAEEITEVTLYRMILEQCWPDMLRVKHIPRVLATLKPRETMQEAGIVSSKCEAASRWLAQFGMTVTTHQQFPLLGQLSYVNAASESDVRDSERHVDIIIPTTGRLNLLSPCLESLLANTKYHNYDVHVVVNGKVDPEGVTYLQDKSATNPSVHVMVYHEPYSWSAINNWAVKRLAESGHTPDLLLFLNDDTLFQEPMWLTEMVGAMMQHKVGAVGARLLYLYGAIQHIGVVCRAGNCGHMHKGFPAHLPGYNGICITSHEATAVTGACMMTSADIFNQMSGFDEAFAMNFNDVAYCLELRRMGYTTVVAAKAELMHHEGRTRPPASENEGFDSIVNEAKMLTKLYPEEDPYWNDNLNFVHVNNGIMVSGMNMDMLTWPPKPWPWRQDEWEHDTVLLVGDDGVEWVRQSQAGNVVYFLALNGLAAQIVRPVMMNLQPMDLRESANPGAVLMRLGVNKIIVRSVLGGTADVLPWLLNFGLPVEYRPATAEAVCPRLDYKIFDGKEFVPCQNGWAKNLCQQCVTQSGSPFGCISLAGWHDQWQKFLEKVELGDAPDDETAQGIQELYLGISGEEVVADEELFRDFIEQQVAE